MPPDRSRRTDRKLSEEIGMLFGRTHRAFRHIVTRVTDGKIESLIEFGMLYALVLEGSGTQAEVALRMGQHPTAVSRVIEDLEQRKLVRRRRDPKDRRKFCVEATAAGRAMVESSREVMMSAVEEFLRGLDHADRVSLRTVLEKIALAHEEPRTAATGSGR